MARKEARIREDQYVALARLVRILLRRRTDRSGPRITENTLIRIAIDLLLVGAHRLIGNTEVELRASVLPPPPNDVAGEGVDNGDTRSPAETYDPAMDGDGLGAPNCDRCLMPTLPVGDGRATRWECPECGEVRIS